MGRGQGVGIGCGQGHAGILKEESYYQVKQPLIRPPSNQ